MQQRDKSKPLDRFSTSLVLVVDDEHEYTVKSPSFSVGQRVSETGRLVSVAEVIRQRREELPDDDPQQEALATEAEQVWAQLAELVPKSGEQESYYRSLLGDTLDEMERDGIPYEVVRVAAATVQVWLMQDRVAAYECWNNGGRPPNPTRRQRRAKTRTTS